MKRRQMVLIAGFGITIVVVLLSAVVMVRGLSAAAEMRRERDSARTQLEGYFRRNPFPTEENIAREKASLETVREWYERLLASLKASDVPQGDAQPSVFNSRRESIVAELIALAPTGEGGARVVPDDFAFGFDRYKTGVLADPRDVPRLMRQLLMIDQLVRELYAAGVLRIVSLAREEFEGAAAESVDIGGGGRRGGRRGGAEPASAEPAGRRIAGVVPMDCQRFRFELVADEESLVDLLNRISRMPIFAVVTHLSIGKEGTDYVLAPALETLDSTQAPGGAANPLPLSRTARLVSGRDREAKLKTTLAISVYSFEAEEG